MTLAIVVQARTGSTRAPGKVLADVCGRPMLVRQLERLAHVKREARLVVATTVDAADDPIVDLALGFGVDVHRGHPTDLLARHVRAARSVLADAVVKIPSDCPLVDPRVVDHVLDAYYANEGAFDYVGNLHPASWPDGNDVEVMPLAALERADREASKPHEREHTTPYFWDSPEKFRIGKVIWANGRDLSMSHRFTVDYPEDIAFVRAVYDVLLSKIGIDFSVDDVVDLLTKRPDIRALNATYAGVNWYRHHLSELRTVAPKETRWPKNP